MLTQFEINIVKKISSAFFELLIIKVSKYVAPEEIVLKTLSSSNITIFKHVSLKSY